jgi:trehalose-6-phosphatase
MNLRYKLNHPPRASSFKAHKKKSVISDIDGTLVPHPYFSGISAAERKSNVRRLAELCKVPQFGLVTGRTWEGYNRIFSDSGETATFPSLLGLEFGSQLYQQNKQILTTPNSPGMHKLLDELSAELELFPEFRNTEDLFSRMKSGKIHGLVIERKAAISQVEWYFSEPHIQSKCAHIVKSHINPVLLEPTDVTIQLFDNRIDLISTGYIPKQGFLDLSVSNRDKEITARLDNQQSSPDPYSDFSGGLVLALGDEFYDSYMFRYLKSLEGRRFERAYCIAVQRPLPFADAFFEDISSALDFVEELIST